MMVLQYAMVIQCVFQYVVMKLCRYTPIFHHAVQERIHKLFKVEGGGGIWERLMKTYVDRQNYSLWHGSEEDIHPWKIIFLEGEFVYYSV